MRIVPSLSYFLSISENYQSALAKRAIAKREALDVQRLAEVVDANHLAELRRAAVPGGSTFVAYL